MLLIPSLKKKTKQQDIMPIADPLDFYIPMDAYRNAMSPLVKIGQHVKKHEVLAQAEGIFASKIHAPVSGEIKAFFHLNGKPMIHLQNDYANETVDYTPINVHAITHDDLLTILLDNGIQGAGGSQFPTQLKYTTLDRKIDTIIFNGVECEPYLSADFALMKEKSAELLKTALLLKSILKVNRIVIAIEKQNKELKKIFMASFPNLEKLIEIKILPDTYPQGGELQLLKAVTKKEIKKGSIPADYGVLVNNIGTLWAIYNAIYESKPATERVITISGNGCTQLGNYWVKIGTPILHILRETNNTWNPDTQTIVLGGAMMGKAVDSPLTPIHKGSGGLLVMQKNKVLSNNCIKCGLCVDVCPQKLMPLEFVRHNITADVEALKNFNLQDCIECGSCAYVCPSDVPLMQNIFAGKTKLTVPS